MKIWIVNAQENPPEPRSKIGRRQWLSNSLSEVLADRGHSVIRWRSSFSHQKKQQLVDESALVELDNYQQQFVYGCTPETLRRRVRQSETDQGKRSGISTTDSDRLKALERENRELKQANEILCKASAFFAQAECGRQPLLRRVR